VGSPADISSRLSPRDLIDIDRYPIDDLDSDRGRAVIDRCRRDLAASGACQLEGFLSDDAVTQLTREALALGHLGVKKEGTHNVYFEELDPELPDDDARRIMQRSSQSTVAYDLIPTDAGIRAVYAWDALLQFVGTALGKSPFYRQEDPLGALNLVYYAQGDELGWHFDRVEFVVTLMLQPAASGGDFEYIPNLRNENEENYPLVQRLLQGDMTDVIHLPSPGGTLALFRGRHSIHRVTPIDGDVLRTNAVLSFADKPGTRLNQLTQQLFYGRTA
jgi:hypothetical protein